jgi:hypothetical protein
MPARDPTDLDLDKAPDSTTPLVTLGQIAELAGVGRSAVSNWRKRFEDFPPPTASATGGRDLFLLPAVEAWLITNKRLAREKESERLLFSATDILRADLDVRGIIEVLCAALTFVYFRGGAAGLARRAAVDRRLDEDASPAELFAPLETLEPETCTQLLRLVGRHDRVAIPSLLDGVLARHPRFVETRTSDKLSELLIRLSLGDAPPPYLNRVFDPAAGQGGLLLAAARATGSDVELAGQEISDAALRIARQRLYVEGHRAELTHGDSLIKDAHPDLRADVVLCDPPYGIKASFPAAVLTDARWAFGKPGVGVADYAWLQHVVHHLTADGRGYVLLPLSTLFRDGGDARVRAAMLRSGAVEAVVALPARAADHTAMPLALWIVRRPNGSGDPTRVLLVDSAGASAESGNPLDGALIERIAQAVEFWRCRAEVREEDRRFAVAVSVLDLDASANLLPARWVCGASELDVESRRRDLRAAVAEIGVATWELLKAEINVDKLVGDPGALAWISIGELVAEGRAEIVRGIRLRPEDSRPNGRQVLRPRDVQPGGDGVTAYVDRQALPRWRPITRRGDIVVALLDDHLATMVEEDGGRLLALPVQALRLDEEWLDPLVAAAFLASPRNHRLLAGMSSTRMHLDMRELQLPRLPRDEIAELRGVLDRIEQGEQFARDILTASREAREALLDLGGYAAAPGRSGSSGAPGGR